MNIRRKAAAVAGSAVLLASIFSVAVAPAALASATVGSAGTVPVGGTSTGTVTFTFQENSAACFSTAADTDALDVQIQDSNGNNRVHFVGTPVVTAPGSLGATATVFGANSNKLQISFAGSDSANIEQVTISGLMISADTNAHAGAIETNLIAPSNEAGCVLPGTTTATGTLSQTVLNTAGNKTFLVTLAAGSCAFEPTSITGTQLVFASNSEGVNIIAPSTTTLNGAINATTTAVTTNAAVPLGTTTIQVDNEQMTVTAGSGTTALTVTRGANGTAAVAHSNGAPVTAFNPIVAGQQNLTTQHPTVTHNIGESVSQTGVTNCNLTLPAPLASAGTVASALTEIATSTTILPGEMNQVGGTADLSEFPSGTGTDFTAGEVITFTITAPTTGVVFSGPEIAEPSSGLDLGAGPGNDVPCSPNITRTACTVTVVSNAAGTDDIFLTGPSVSGPGGINFDVAAGTPLGTAVKVTATTSTAYAVNLSSTTVAFVGRTVVGVGAQPTIYIGFNAQQTGLITLQESGAGFFVSGVGGNNTFAVCLATGEVFTFAPFAVVTVAGGTPGLQLENGVSPASTKQGTLYDSGNCAFWTVYSSSTTGPATIEIRGSADGITPLATGPNNGPTVNVPSFLAPGSTQMAILIGTSLGLGGGCSSVAGCVATPGFNSFATNAVRAFKNSVVVTAVSNPVLAPGTADGLAGNVTITETQNGQFKPGDVVVFQYLPRATTVRNDLIIEPGNTNELPIFNTNVASGLLVSPVTVVCPASALLGITFCAFTTTIVQQSFGPTLGQITVSNIHVQIAADAILGPENLRVTNTGILGFTTPTGQSFDSVISNVTVGHAPGQTTITNASAAGVQNSGSFTTSTKIVPLNKYVTFQATTNLPVATHVTVWIAVKTNGVWSAFSPVTSRVVDVNGHAYYYWRSSTAKWVSVKFSFAGNSAFGPNQSLARQAETR